MASKRLYVGNLPYEVSEDDLRSLFEPYGPITDVQVISGRGFAFVEVPAERAQDAIQAINGTTQWGRGLVVSEARPRAEPGGDRGRGGGFRREGGPREAYGGRGAGGGRGGRGGRRGRY